MYLWYILEQYPIGQSDAPGGCHSYKLPYPRDAMTVYLQSRQITNCFSGFFDMVIYAPKGSAKQNDTNLKTEATPNQLQMDFTVTEDFPASKLVTF